MKGNATLLRPASVANDNAPTEIMIIHIIFCGGVCVAAVEGAAIVGAAFYAFCALCVWMTWQCSVN